MIIFPEKSGEFRGEVIAPLTYARSQFTVQVQTGSGAVCREGKVRKGFAIPEAPEVQEGRLTGVVVCIDPGHQEKGKQISEPLGPGLKGNSSGTLGMAQGCATTRREYIVTLEAAYALRDELMRQGATVVLTRASYDGFVSNLERCEIAENAGAHIMLRLHCNNSSKPNKQGIQVYAPHRSDYAQALCDEETYRAMGDLLLDATKRAVGYELHHTTGTTRLSDRYVGNNWAKMMCFLVEMGYMSNVAEDIKLATPEYQQMLAEGMAQGVYEIAVARGWVTEEQ